MPINLMLEGDVASFNDGVVEDDLEVVGDGQDADLVRPIRHGAGEPQVAS